MRSRRILAALAAGLLAFLVALPGSAAAAAQPRKGTPGYCPDATGVTVIIDFQQLGGTTIIRCAPGAQPSGLAALQNSGINITGTARWGLGFICRIEGKPGPQGEPCIDTPPASAYWSYWHSPNGGKWHYSDWGVKNRKPPPGSFEGWSFSKNRTATTNPAPRIAPVRPAKKPSDGDLDNGSGDKEGDRPRGDGGGAAKPSRSASPGPSATPEGERTPGPADTPTQDPAWTGGDDIRPAAGSEPQRQMPRSTALGIGFALALVICAGFAVLARVRRNRS